MTEVFDGVSRCTRCGRQATLLYPREPDRVFGSPGLWNIYQCSSPTCGQLFPHPPPSAKELQRAYARYYTHEPSQAEMTGRLRRVVRAGQLAHLQERHGYPAPASRSKSAVAAALRLWPGRLLDASAWVMQLDAPTEPARLLDVGCGSGAFLERMSGLGWTVEGTETDPSAGAVAARSATVHIGELLELELPANSYAAVTLSHVIEHVDDPLAVLKQCRSLLRPGGRLIVVTPNADSWLRRAFGRTWRGLEVPRHLRIYTKDALADDARLAGFTHVQVTTSAHAANTMYLSSSEMAAPARSRPVRVRRRIGAELVQQAEVVAVAFGLPAGEEIWLTART